MPVTPTIAFSSDARVTSAEGRTSRRDQAEDERARRLGGVRLRGIGRRNAAEADRAEPEEVDRDRHRVRGEMARAGAEAGAGVTFELGELASSIRPLSWAPTASQTSWIVTGAPRCEPAAIAPE